MKLTCTRSGLARYVSPTVSLASSLAVAMMLSGCGRNNEPAPGTDKPVVAAPGTTTPTTPDSDFKVALIMSGSKTDGGWNTSAAKALDEVKTELKLSDDNVKSVDNQKDATSQAKSLQDFAAKKFTLVFGHGTEYEAPALAQEANFPKTMFVISSGGKLGKNTMPIVFKLEDGAYLEGMLAAGMSKTGKLACVGATKEASLERVFAAFERGAKSVNPKIIVIPPAYTGDWDNIALAKSQTLALLNQGADVIMQDVDSAAQGVFNAVQEFNKSGKKTWALGTNGDQNSKAPDVILASAPIYTNRAFVTIAKAAKAGTLKANETPLGMKDGIIDFVINPALKDTINKAAPMLIDDLEKTRKSIIDGSLDVSKDTP